MTTAASLASYASNFPSFRNRIINGNLSNPINQRGAGSITASTGYTYDRWYYDGSTYLYQGIEDKNVNNGTYVISWVGAGINAAWKVSTDTTANNGPDATTGFTSVSNGGTFTVSEGTEYSKHLWIRFDGTLANLDKVMVEEGTVATPFEHRPYGTELALCQRYFEVWSGNGYNGVGSGGCTATNGVDLIYQFLVQKRSSVTATISAAGDFYMAGSNWGVPTTCNSISFLYSTDKNVFIQARSASTPLTIGQSGVFGSNNTSNAKLNFSAEL
jgi:hypothetical protein